MSIEKKVVLGILVLVVFLLGITLAPDRSRGPAVAEEVAAPPLNVTAEELYAAYAANEVSADDKFRGKRILVYGPVSSIDKDIADNIVVRLEGGGNSLATVDATIPNSEKSKAAALAKGDKIALLCLGAGRSVGSPRLDRCSFQQ